MHAVAGLTLQPAELEILLDAHALRTGRGPAARSRCRDARSARTNSPISSLSASLIDPFDGRRDPDQRLQQRRLAGAVAAEQRDDLVVMQREVDIVENMALAVERIDIG